MAFAEGFWSPAILLTLEYEAKTLPESSPVECMGCTDASSQECLNGRGRSGGQTAGGHPKAFPRPRQPLFAVPALRELDSACRFSIL